MLALVRSMRCLSASRRTAPRSNFPRGSATYLSLALGLAVGARGANSYSIQDLGVLPGYTGAQASAVNVSGQITGYCSVGDQQRAFLYNPSPSGGGTLIDLGALPGGTHSMGTGLNSLGQVVGMSDTQNAEPRAFIDLGAGLIDVVGGNGGANIHAWGVNDAGLIAGSMTNSGSGNPSQFRAMMWTPDPDHPGRYLDLVLPELTGGDPAFTFTTAAAINQLGEVAGECFISDGTSNHAILWRADPAHTIVDLANPAGGASGWANDVNDLSDLVGWTYVPFEGERGVLWSGTNNHQPLNLGLLPGWSESAATAINNHSEIVGTAFNAAIASRAIYFDRGSWIDLNTRLDDSGAGWVLLGATDINDHGLIVGYGTRNGLPRAFALTPRSSRGDMNCDGFVTVGDIRGFVLALTDAAAYGAQFPNCDIHNADTNGDGFVSVGDIGAFVALLII